MTSMPHLAAMAWDHADRLQHCDLGGGGEVWFVYDASGARVRKVQRNASGSRVRERVYLGEFELYRERAANDVAPEMERQTLHVGDGARRLCLVETLTVDDGEPVAAPVSVPRFQHGNHLDSASLELDGDAAVISYEEFHPFGTTSYAANDGAIEVSAKRYRYIGKERDEETGLYHLGARYYAAWLGRWTAADPTGLADGVNRYAYCRGSPVTLRDTSGSGAETPGLVVERALLQARHTAIEAQLLALDARDAAATASRRQFSEAMARQRIEVGGLQAAVQLQRRYTASRGWLDTVTRMPTLTELGDAIAEDIALRPFAYAPGIGPAIAATHHTHDAGDAWSRRQYLEASGHVAGALGEAALAYLDIAAPAAGVAEHGAERVITLFSKGKKVVRSAAVRTAEGNASREAERVAAEGGEKVYRVRGGTLPNASKERFAVGEGGELSIQGDDMLYINLGQEGRALEFLGRRGDTAVLVEFEVSSEFATTLRTTSVPQRAGRSSPGAAQRVDETRGPDQFGIPSNMFQDLLDSVVPGSVRVRKQ
ncbi:MAG: RHS repeat-associated core domain-containing protein [Deltaproteobacteria bacterium]|nr:RHS repeat-associated core domain-containing protein [Deltaproteobacteria bacterium]